MRGTARGVTAALALFGLASAQTGAPVPAPRRAAAQQCFFASQFQQWKAVDDKTITIRVNVNDLYRLEMASSCPELTYADSHLVNRVVGSHAICSPIDWDLSVSSGVGMVPTPCIVSKMTRLTPEEAAAIPKKDLPD